MTETHHWTIDPGAYNTAPPGVEVRPAGHVGTFEREPTTGAAGQPVHAA